MTHWLIPANTKFYDVLSAFAQNTAYWPMSANLSSGDIVYIYLAAPYKQLGFICEVLSTGHNLDDIFSDIAPYLKGRSRDTGPPKPFMTLRNIHPIPLDPNSPLSLNHLKQHGLNGMLMGARKLDNNPELSIYIRKNSP
jgi:hypothetical protein